MTFFRHSWRGGLFVLGVLGLNTYLWFTAVPVVPQPFDSIVSQMLGGVILTSFFLVFLLSTRMGWLVNWFGGMDRMYAYHRWLAILPLFLILIHEELSEAIIEVLDVESPILGEANDAGETAQKLFIGLIVIALLAKFLKYEHWRFIHRLMILPFIYGLYHAFYSSTYALFSGSPLSIFMMTIAIGGMASSLYMVMVYQWWGFSRHGTVTHITYPNDDTLDVEITLKKPLRYEPGQFVFLKIFQKGIEDAPHPFSISGSSGNKVYFTIKTLGDFTRKLRTSLHLATRVRLSRAYGTMTLQTKGTKQVWIAGGIGLTPFLAQLRQPYALNPDVRFFYVYRQQQDAVALEMIRQYEQHDARLTFIPHESKTMGRLTVEQLNLQPDEEVYLCGPQPMVHSLVRAIKKANPKQKVDYEAFQFMGTILESIWSISKKILRLFVTN